MDDHDRERRIAQGRRRLDAEAQETAEMAPIGAASSPAGGEARPSILAAMGAIVACAALAILLAFAVGAVAHLLWLMGSAGWRWV